MGRPSDYTSEIADKICHRLAEGESLRAICRDDEMPGRETVRVWLSVHPEFKGKFDEARILQAEGLADELMEIADDGTNDYVERVRDGKTETAFDAEHVARSRLRVDTRKWYLSKVLPKVYGDKLQHTGEGGDGPIVVEIVNYGAG